MPRVNRIKKARKPQGNCGKCGCPIKAGDPYVWWKFQFGGTKKRCDNPACFPSASDLTQSAFLSTLYEIQDSLAECTTGEGLLELTESIRDLGLEQEDRLANMPDSLQYSPTGELLQDRADACSQWADDLENHAGGFEELQQDLNQAGSEDECKAVEDAIENWVASIPEYPG